MCLWLALLSTGQARAVTVYDLNPQATAPTLPTVIDNVIAPVYVTNSNSSDAAGTGSVDSLRVGQYSSLHLGYGDTAPAAARVAVNVAGNAVVDGNMFLGKDQTSSVPGLPDAATSKAVSLSIGGNLVVNDGGLVIADGASDGTDAVEHSAIRANRALIDGGRLVLDDYASLTTAYNAAPGASGARVAPSVRIGTGGSLVINGGLPPQSSSDTWIFKGVDVSAGGDGVLVDRGGVLAAGISGGVIKGKSGQRLQVEKGGMLDAAQGSILVTGMNNTAVYGGYRAGYGRSGAATTYLTAEGGNVFFGSGSVISLSRDLQRRLNRGGATTYTDAVILRGGDIAFEAGAVPSLKTGMGVYSLARETVTDSATSKTWEQLRVNGVENAVAGNFTAADRELFRQNMESVWNPGRMAEDQADNIYNLTAVETPSVVAYGASGSLNQAVLEAFVDGVGQPTGTGGVADKGLFEMYNAGAQWGVSNVAHNTAAEFMAGLNRRVDRLGAEMDRLGDGWGSPYALASCSAPDLLENRVWVGGFGRNEEADLDYGVSGYKYNPRGVMAGFDNLYGPFTLGAAFAYGRGDYKDLASEGNDSKITSYSAGLYGAYHAQNGLNLSAFATYSHLENDLSDLRGGMRRTADHSAYVWSAGGRLGYDMMMTDKVMLSPSAGIVKVRSESKSHDEFLDGVSVLRVGDVRRNSTLVPLDVTVGYDVLKSPVAIFRLMGNVGYAYDLEKGGLEGMFSYDGLAGATSMSVAGRNPGRHRFNLGAGFIFSERYLDLGARYDYFKRSEQETHQVQGSVGVKF